MKSLFPDDNGAGTLMSGEHQHLGNLHMGRSLSRVDSHIGDVIAGERLYTLIYIIGAFGVAVEACTAEVGLHKAGLYIGDSQRSEIGRASCRERV